MSAYEINPTVLGEITDAFNEITGDDSTTDEIKDILGYSRRGDGFRAWVDDVSAETAARKILSYSFSQFLG